MNSEYAYTTHMKKHNQRRGRKVDYADSQQMYADQ